MSDTNDLVEEALEICGEGYLMVGGRLAGRTNCKKVVAALLKLRSDKEELIHHLELIRDGKGFASDILAKHQESK